MSGKFLIAIGIICGVLVLSVAVIAALVFSANKPKGNHEEILPGKEQSDRHALIVYQPSILDASGRIARQIARGLNDGGYEVTLNNPGEHLPGDISRYRIVVFGSAVYCGQPAKALLDYMSRITGYPAERVVLYSSGGVPQDTQEFTAMEKTLKGVKPYKMIKFNIKEKGENDERAYELGKELAQE